MSCQQFRSERQAVGDFLCVMVLSPALGLNLYESISFLPEQTYAKAWSLQVGSLYGFLVNEHCYFFSSTEIWASGGWGRSRGSGVCAEQAGLCWPMWVVSVGLGGSKVGSWEGTVAVGVM